MARIKSEAGSLKADIVDFDGVRYYRYPDSPRHDRSCYYWSKSHKPLHRAIWEKANGPIPEGYVIHHKDGNTLNNTLENLECLSKTEHSTYHGKEHGGIVTAETKATLVCDVCGAHFEGSTGHRQYFTCSEHCRNIAQRVVQRYLGAIDYVPQVQQRKSTRHEVTCANCGTVFSSVKATARFCSKKCRDAYTWREGKTSIQKNGYITLTCAVCGKEFKSRNKDARCCSQSCVNRYRWHKDSV